MIRWIDSIFSKRKRRSDIKGVQASERNVTPSPANRTSIIGDNPIWRPEDDALGRADAARSFAKHVLSLDASEGVVVGVLGPWGSGKTSFINLARGHFHQIGVSVLDFNPWLFSGAEELVKRFFIELSADLRMRPDLAEIGTVLQEYGEVLAGASWVPVVGSWIERFRVVMRLAGQILQRQRGGLNERRKRLEKSLQKLDSPIIVVLDDIDRLLTHEIRDVFKLVRLTASFPNIIYILAFDRTRVEEALEEHRLPGRDYLEKILQLVVDLPSMPADILDQQIFSALDRAITGTENPGSFDQNAWPDIFVEIVRPLIRNMRDVRRYAAAVHGTVRSLNGEIALVDLLGLEAVRVFLPDVFVRLEGAVDGLTKTAAMSSGRSQDPPELEAQVHNLIEAAGSHGGVARAVIDRLFPAGCRHVPSQQRRMFSGGHYGPEWKDRWLRERRVAHEDVLRLYLERIAGKGFQAFKEAEGAWPHMADRDNLDRYLRSLDITRLQDVIESLEVFEDEFTPEQVVPAAIVLLNLLPDLPQRQRGMFSLETDTVVTRVVYRLLRSLKEPDIIAEAVRQIVPELTSLYSKFRVITIVGHQKNAGHKLVQEASAADLERSWRDEVRSASVEVLVKEHSVLWVLFFAKQSLSPSEEPILVDDAPELTLAVLGSALRETLSQSIESRAVRRSPRLDWDALVELYGDEETLRQRIETLKAAQLEGTDDLLELADRYLAGWRPNRLGG